MNEFCSLFVKRFSRIRLNVLSPVAFIPTRNTYILKRRFEPFIAKLNATKPRELELQHYIYDLVEDTDEKEPPDLHVILTSFTEGIGDVGDLISGEPQYLRESLLLPKKAVYATPENIEYYEDLKKNRPERPDFSSIYAGITARFLSKKIVPIFMNDKQPWTLEPWHLKVAFRLEGIIVPLEAIKLPDVPIAGPDSNLEQKDFAVFVTINNREVIPVRCRIFLFDESATLTKLSEEFYLEKREAIIEEQKELLNSLPEPEIEDNRPEANISLKEKYRIKVLN